MYKATIVPMPMIAAITIFNLGRFHVEFYDNKIKRSKRESITTYCYRWFESPDDAVTFLESHLLEKNKALEMEMKLNTNTINYFHKRWSTNHKILSL
jgi:hypothetical protein